VSIAEVEPVEPDDERAREFLAQAAIFVTDADRVDSSSESSVVLYWQACISAMDAILAKAGLRVGSGVDSHRVRIEAVAGLVGTGYAELFVRLNEWRRERGGVSYAALTPSQSVVVAMQGDARDILEVAATYLNS
jgi:hypothetical protein